MINLCYALVPYLVGCGGGGPQGRLWTGALSIRALSGISQWKENSQEIEFPTIAQSARVGNVFPAGLYDI